MSDISLVDVGLKWFEDILAKIVEWFRQGLVAGYDELTKDLFGTPTPETGDAFVFGRPTNEPWTDLYEALVGGEAMLIALLLLLLAVQGRHTIQIFNFGTGYEAQRTRRTAWTGAFLIVVWYWGAVLMLYLVDGFTIGLLPGVQAVAVSMEEFLATTVSNPMLSLLLASIGSVAMWILQAVFYLREVLLYVYLYAMPIGIAITFGNIPIASRITKSICLNFVPLAIMPLPVALLFKGYELLFATGSNSPVAPESSFLSYVVAISLPVLSVLLVWKLFKYAAPLTSGVVSRATQIGTTAGAIAGAGYLAGPQAATTAARWGSTAAASQVATTKMSNGSERDTNADGRTETESTGTGHDNVAGDSNDQGGIPQYRRTENDPGYY